jgi:hypothetical protein
MIYCAYQLELRPEADVFQSILVQSGFLGPSSMAHSKAKLKSNGDKASPYSRPF